MNKLIKQKTTYAANMEYYFVTVDVIPPYFSKKVDFGIVARLEAVYLPTQGQDNRSYISGRIYSHKGKWHTEFAKGAIDALTQTGKGFYTYCPEAEIEFDTLPDSDEEIAEILYKAFNAFIKKRGFKNHEPK